MGFGALVLGYAVVFRFWQVGPVPLEAYLAGILVWAISLVPIFIWFQRGRAGVPIFELICVAYGISYGVPVYLVPNQILIQSQMRPLDWSIITECLLMACLALGVLTGGYYITLRFFRKPPRLRADLPFTATRRSLCINLALICGLLVSVIISLSPSSSSMQAILRLLASQFYVGLALLSYEVFSAERMRKSRLALLCACAGMGSLLALSGGMLEGVVLPVMLVLIVRWHVRHRFPYMLAAALGVLFLILNPLKHEYRERVWYGEAGGAGIVERLDIWMQLIGDRLAGKGPAVVEEDGGGFQAAMERVDLLHKFAHVKTITPAEIPFLRGLSYEYMLYGYIPRFLWPDKPAATEATDLVDFAYGFRSPNEENKGTKIAIGQIAEAYVNLGIKGIIIVMACQGIFFALINRVFNSPQSMGGRAIYLVAMAAFLNGIGTSAVILFGGILQFLVASAVLIRPFATSFAARGEAGSGRERRRVRVRTRKQRTAAAAAPPLP